MQIKEELTIKDFMEMTELEKLFYKEDHITPSQEVCNWYKTCPHVGKVMEEQGKIIGFLDMFPIKDHIYEAIKNGSFNDKDLEVTSIVEMETLKPGDKVNMYLCCLIMLPQYRKSGALDLMFRAQIDYFDQFVKKGVIIENIIVDNVTESGERYSKRKGLKKVTDTIFNSVIYMGSYSEFTKQFYI